MLTFEAASAEHYGECMQLMLDEAGGYLQGTLKLMQISMDEFNHLLRTVGTLHAIFDDKQLAGFYWIEEREKVLHLHALLLKQQFQGKGIGTQTLNMLASKYEGTMTTIELGVHDSNEAAIRLYERKGFNTVKRLNDLKFRIMQKDLSSANPIATGKDG
jgi:ribosomal protein S18 acetylase RimI-like enzyme